MFRLVLIDGHAILYRAYHALPLLTTSKGEPSGAVYGFVSILLRIINDLKPTNLAVVFDRPEPTFRKKLFSDYQIQRPKMEDSLQSQVKSTHDLVKTLGIAIYESAGYEADDVIGTIALQVKSLKKFKDIKEETEKKETEVIIVTGDRDLLQLVDKTVLVYMPLKGLSEAKIFGIKEVIEKFGVTPGEIIDYKGLVGDASDNYSGVSGIGPKTAENLIKKYGSLENIYNSLDQIEGKLRDKLTTDKDKAFLSKKLATILQEVPIKFDLKSSKLISLDRPEVRAAFTELEFKSLIARLSADNKKQPAKNTEQKKENNKVKNKDSFSEQTKMF